MASTRSNPARIAAIVLGAILALMALGIVASGAALLVGQSVYDEDGFITSPSERVETDTYAIATQPFNVEGLDEWPFDDPAIRLRLTLDSDEDVFVGVARAEEAAAVLEGIEHEVVTGEGRTGAFGDIETDVRPGGAPPTIPADLLDWEVSATGRDDVAVTWEPTEGDWVVLAMAADGSNTVDVRGRIGAEVPYLDELAWSLLIGGAILGLIAAVLIAIGARHPRGALTVPTETEPVDHPGALPVRVRARVDVTPSRWLWLFKWLLLIPHYIAIVFLSAAFVIVTIIAWFAIVFTGRYPRSLFDFNLGVLRWNWRINGYGYGAFATDRYPPFSRDAHPDYPATLDIDYPEHLSRGLPFVKWLLAMPHLLLIGAAAGGVVVGTATPETTTEIGVIGLVIVFIGAGLLFTGRLPTGLFDLLVGIQRWIYRTVAYVALMTDEYPPFRLDQGGDEPASAQVRDIRSDSTSFPP